MWIKINHNKRGCIMKHEVLNTEPETSFTESNQVIDYEFDCEQAILDCMIQLKCETEGILRIVEDLRGY